MSCSAHLGYRDQVICGSRGAEILSYKQTLQERALVYRGPVGGEWRETSSFFSSSGH